MTAIGVLMMMAGLLTVVLTDNPDTETVGSGVFWAGAIVSAIGVVVWLWRVMP